MSSLYLKHFDLNRPPFQITPDTDFFFSGSQRGGILTALLHVAGHEEGIAIAVAEVGSGKTLLARLLISQLPATVDTVYLANPCFNRDEIIAAISRDMGLPALSQSTEENLSRLHRELMRRHAQGRRVLLVIDEAHAMPSESIEEVRMLSNLETDRHKLVNIILFGQPELDELLADRKLRQVRDRVTHRIELPPLTPDEAEAYVDHRLRIAGWRGGKLFTAAGLACLVKASHGRARRINLLADKALLAAYAKAARQVDKPHVETAIAELDATSTQGQPAPRTRWAFAAAGFLGGVAVALVAVWSFGGRQGPAATEAIAAAGRVNQAHAAMIPGSARKPSDATTPVRDSAPASAVSGSITTAAAKPSGASGASGAAVAEAGSREAEDIFKRTAAAVSDPALQGYTLQLATLPARTRLAAYLDEIRGAADPATLYAHHRTYGDKHVLAVYQGRYPDEAAARTALAALPEQLKSSQPVVRTWAGIRSEQQP